MSEENAKTLNPCVITFYRLGSILLKESPLTFFLGDESLVESSLDSIHKKWFVNLSGIEIPLDVQRLFQLGDCFGLLL